MLDEFKKKSDEGGVETLDDGEPLLATAAGASFPYVTLYEGVVNPQNIGSATPLETLDGGDNPYPNPTDTGSSKDGTFSFSVPTGTYTLVETDPDGFISTTSNYLSLYIEPGGESSANLFGDRTPPAGYVYGRVFNDNGDGGGIAKNGAQDGNEPGISDVTLDLIGSINSNLNYNLTSSAIDTAFSALTDEIYILYTNELLVIDATNFSETITIDLDSVMTASGTGGTTNATALSLYDDTNKTYLYIANNDTNDGLGDGIFIVTIDTSLTPKTYSTSFFQLTDNFISGPQDLVVNNNTNNPY
jgi:hypothetical protein